MDAKVEKSRVARIADPCTLVVFGASGDLTQRLLLPALYNLAADGLLPDAFAVIGVARSEMNSDDFREEMRQALDKFATRKLDAQILDGLVKRLTYVRGSGDDADALAHLKKELERIEADRPDNANRIFYMATPPSAFAPIANQIAQAGLAKEENGHWRRLIIEKPFGYDLASARKLNAELLKAFDETQIYRIDHYLGKETVQNIMVLRFANGLFEPIWNRNHIDHVQITVAESLTVGRRGKFYDATGALRDMVANHLFQLLSLVAMEPPSRFEADPVRAEKAEVLSAVHVMSEEEAQRKAVRAQYAAGMIGANAIGDYLAEADIARDSATETYAALELSIDNWRWAGVPFYLRTGKALSSRMTEVAIKFKRAPFAMFRSTSIDALSENFLVIGVQPNECISLQFNAKVPGPEIAISGVDMTFRYKDYFEAAPSTGYETLIYDCMIGDAILFQRADGVEAGWRILQPVLDAWKKAGRAGMATYEAGAAGPKEAEDLIARSGRSWRALRASG
jgi:glucose-6-phosphate 1-dehydrogenase